MLREINIFWLEKGELDKILQKLFPFPEDMGPHLPLRPREYWSIQIPKLNRVFPELCAKDLVDVQPMSDPSSEIYYWDIPGYNPFKETHYQQV